MKSLRLITTTSLAIVLSWFAQAQIAPAQTEVSLRTVGVIQPDALNNLDGMVARTDTFQIVTTIRSLIRQDGGTLGFMLYSPDNSISDYSLLNIVMTSWWLNVWTLSAGLSLDTNGSFPEQFLTGGSAALPGGGLLTETFQDMLVIDMAIPTAGTICLDSAFFPPAGEWLMTGDGQKPDWLGGGGDLTVGGARPSAFCITIIPEDCCQVPGDADHSGSTNIGDVTFMISRIFAGGQAPVCINEADADGDGAFNIADVSFLIARIFSGGPAPVCGNIVN